MSVMNLKGRTLVLGVLVAALIGFASPAYAQVGTVKGRVVDEKGAPVPDADLTFDFLGELRLHFTGKTDKNGQFTRAGLLASGGFWSISAKKGNLSGTMRNIDVPLQAIKNLDDIVI